MIKVVRFGDNHEKLLEFAEQTPFFSMYSLFLKQRHFASKSDVCGLVLIENDKTIGSTLLMIHDENELCIGNVSCTFVAPEHRGKGLSASLINAAKDYCDIVTNITPVDSIITLMKNNSISNFSKTSDFQMWIKPKKIHKVSDDIKVKGIRNSDIPLLQENINNNVVFYQIEDGDKKCIVGLYTFFRKRIKVSEVIYVSDNELFRQYFYDSLKLISNIHGNKLFFVDNNFVGISSKLRILKNKKTKSFYLRNLFLLMFKKAILLESRKYFWSKNKNWNINYLSSEFCFYK